jgi:hypothetical protein
MKSSLAETVPGTVFKYLIYPPVDQERPYHDDCNAPRLLSEAKYCRARLALRWGTTLESRVLFLLLLCHDGVATIALFVLLLSLLVQ